MDWYRTVFETIDMRSFSNLWFWIALAVMWASASHRVLGIPYDMVLRARRQGGIAVADLEAVTMVHVRRILCIADVAGPWLAGIAAFLLSALATLGFWLGVEFAQAVLLLAAPMTLVGALRLRAARRIAAAAATGAAVGPDLLRRLTRHRMAVQAIGMVAIFVTGMWGMWQNLHHQIF